MEPRTSDNPFGPARDEAAPVRYATLGDYLRVVRRHRIVIALSIVALTTLAFVVSKLQDPTYRTTAQLSFQDPLADIDIISPGTSGTASLPPAVLAARNAELVRDPAVVRGVRKRIGEIGGASVSTLVAVQSNLVNLTVEASGASFAAELANVYATQVQRVAERREIRRINRAERTLERELERSQESGVEFRTALIESQLSRVRTTRAIAEPAEITQLAATPAAPIAPDTMRNSILGGAFGLILGLLVAFVRDSLDRRMHSAHEIHRELGVPILGRVSSTALGRPGLVANGTPPMLDSEFEAFRMLRTNLAALSGEQPVRSVLVSSPQPQEGKSTVSVALASAAAVAGQRVLLIEGDLRRPSFAERLGVSTSPGLSDYLTDRTGPGEILQVVQLTAPTRVNGGPSTAGRKQDPAGQLVVVTAGAAVSQPAELLIGMRFAEMMDKVVRAYDLVVVDSPPLLSVSDALELVPHVDCILVCVRVDRTTREHARAAHAALAHLPERPMGAVVTGIRPGDPDAYDYYYGY